MSEQKVTPRGTLLIPHPKGPVQDSGVVPSTIRDPEPPVDVVGETAPAPASGPAPAQAPAPVDLAGLARQAKIRSTALRDAANDESAPGSNPLPEPGGQILNHLVIGLYAQGGFGLIYELAHTPTRSRRALKILKPRAREDEMHVARMLAEGQLMASCSTNPNICRVFEVGTHPRFGPYVIMELLEGSTLRDLIKNENARGRTIPVKTAVKLVIAIAEALQWMHNQGAVHRDLKPDNVFLVRHGNDDYTVKILDWGAAKHGYSPHSAHVDPVVTIPYMAPEQASRARAITAAADQYALAFILLELAWEHPFASALASGRRGVELMMMHLLEPMPAPPPHLVPEALTKIALRATAKKPEDRYPSMSAFASALREFMEGAWSLAEKPAAQKQPFRPTVLNLRALEAGRTTPGTKLERNVSATPPAPARRVAREEMSAAPTLLVLEPAELRGQRFELGAEGTIGRHPATADIVLDHQSVSNAHVRYRAVQRDGSNTVYCVESLAPSNPPFLARTVLEVSAWKPNQLLELGDVCVCLLPPGAVGADLSWIPLDEARVSGRSADKSRASVPGATVDTAPMRDNEVAVNASCREPTLQVLAPAELAHLRVKLKLSGTIGREDADIVFDHPTVSRAHASYNIADYVPLRILVSDRGSANGSFLMKRGDDVTELEPLVPKKQVSIEPFQKVRFGDIQCVLLPPGRPGPNPKEWIHARDEAKSKPKREEPPPSPVRTEIAPARSLPTAAPAPRASSGYPWWFYLAVAWAILGTGLVAFYFLYWRDRGYGGGP